jgi:hypothetical protein
MTMVKIWETIRLGTEVVVPIIPILKPNSDPSIIQWFFKYQRLMLLFGFQKGKFNRFVTSWRSWFGVHWVKTSAGGAMRSLGFSAPWRRTRDGNIAELRRSPWIWWKNLQSPRKFPYLMIKDDKNTQFPHLIFPTHQICCWKTPESSGLSYTPFEVFWNAPRIFSQTRDVS